MVLCYNTNKSEKAKKENKTHKIPSHKITDN